MKFYLFNIYADGLFYGQLRAVSQSAAVSKARDLWGGDDVYLFEAHIAAE